MENLDKERRYLVPVARLGLSGVPDGVHLAVYEYLSMFDEWTTGPALCGYSTQQDPLPGGTVVTCRACLEWKPRYERMLAPGYRPEDDDPDVLRRQRDEARAEVEAVRNQLRITTAEKLADVVQPNIELLCAEIERLRAEVTAAREFAAAQEQTAPAAPGDTVENGAWHTVWLEGKWRWITSRMTTEQREYAADCVDAYDRFLAAEDDDLDRAQLSELRWWREAGR